MAITLTIRDVIYTEVDKPIKGIRWQVTASQSGESVTIKGVFRIPGGHPAKSVEYQNVTENQCKVWVRNAYDVDVIKKELRRRLKAKLFKPERPDLNRGKPWEAP